MAPGGSPFAEASVRQAIHAGKRQVKQASGAPVKFASLRNMNYPLTIKPYVITMCLPFA